jgi:uncharacterized protein
MKKIIDTHIHLPGNSFGGEPRSMGMLREECVNEGLAAAWIMTTDGLLLDTEKNNDVLAENIEGHRDFFVPFCTVNPHRGQEAAVRELERCRFDLKMTGLKLHPWLQAFWLTHPAVIPILKRAGELKMPVLFHDGTPPYSTPLQIAAAAELVPETTIILGHSGLDDLYNDSILACLRQPNVYLCLCGISAGLIKEVIQRCPIDKLLFGSDGGFMPNLIMMSIEKLLSTGASEEVLEHVFHHNPQRLLPLQSKLK